MKKEPMKKFLRKRLPLNNTTSIATILFSIIVGSPLHYRCHIPAMTSTVRKQDLDAPARIIGVQFSMLSPEEILRNSVVEITSRDTYNNNKPVVGGLFDTRMGVLEPGMICSTDGQTYMNTPGYFGHINLAKPLFAMQHIKEIIKISRCVCFKCSKLLIDKNKYSYILNRSAEDRWEFVSKEGAGIRRCGNETDDGCGCHQPTRIILEGMCKIEATWPNLEGNSSTAGPSAAAAAAAAAGGGVAAGDAAVPVKMILTPEIILKIFRRISDDDVFFMGFHPKWSRPEWMILTVLPVPPPSVRPSVKYDAQQRSEDDLTHIYSNIEKCNTILKEKLADPAQVNSNTVDKFYLSLQYYVAAVVNNKMKGMEPMFQRSTRPLQCIMDRLNTKYGRIRGNLMGKRVDFSARSVITGDPNLSIRQLGVPMKIAKNITKPVVVNARNREFLLTLVKHGPDVYPGAKILERKTGEHISLRHVERTDIHLQLGDVVHRHMMDGDAVLFNRQPSLHRMSMMCHIVKVMKCGDTFRINVGCTKPYNADFDGDEMNMHMSQNVLAETELRHLAAIPYQIISPSGNAPIIGIYQDSLLGSYRFTRENIAFSVVDAMNLLMRFAHVNPHALRALLKKKGGKKMSAKSAGVVSSFDILTQLMPPVTMQYSTKLFSDKDDDFRTSNHVVEIRNGMYVRGQMEKSVLGQSTRGLLHRIYNDFGPMACSNFIDDLQNVITEYMKTSSYSVGISDLIADPNTKSKIHHVIEQQKTEVRDLVDRLHLGIFENSTSRTNQQHFESQVNNLLNKATDESGKIGRSSLSDANRFKIIVDSGSKGTAINISHMISCVGQQNVEGKRIPYGLDGRTLPHFRKYDDGPAARGFIDNSYMTGLSATELFFLAMGGRIGLIDTAVKSVTWETPIVLIERGIPHYTEIGRWIDAKLALQNDKVQHFPNDRNLELLDIEPAESVYIPTTDEHGTVTWGQLTAVTRHDPGTALYEIKTAGGRTVTVTESKSLLVWNPSTKTLNEMLTPDIRVGDCVPVTAELAEPPVVVDSLWLDSGLFYFNADNGRFMGHYLARRDHTRSSSSSSSSSSSIYSVDRMAALTDNGNTLPTETFVAPRDFIVALLRSYFHGQAYCLNDNTWIEITGRNVRLLEGISMLLSRLGIFAQVFPNDLRLAIFGKLWLERFDECFPRLFSLNTDGVMSSLCCLNFDVVDAVFEMYNHVVLDPIVQITKIGVEKHPKMYDVTVPSTLNFGLANGLQVRDTSKTGYIQRRLIKGLEDLKVDYDMTVRNNRGKVIQFLYGEDGFDSTRIENQSLPLVGMSVEDIYLHYDIIGANNQTDEILNIYTESAGHRAKKQKAEAQETCKRYIDKMLLARDEVVKRVFKNKNDSAVFCPIAFQHVIANCQGQLDLTSASIVDITPLEAFQMIEANLQRMNAVVEFAQVTPLFEILYYFYLTPKHLLVYKRFHKKALSLLLDMVLLKFKEALVHPGEMVGIVAGQSIGEPTTQLTLNSLIYEEEILVRNSKKEVTRIKIGEFTEREILRCNNVDYMANQDTTYAPISEYYEVPCATETGETVWRKIEAVTRHPVVNEDGTNTMLKVTTQGCRQVTATKAKSFLQLVDGKIQGVEGKDLKVGDYLPVSRKPLEYAERFVLPENGEKLDYDLGYSIGSNVVADTQAIDKIVFSNRDCIRGFLDAIGPEFTTMSISRLMDIQIMLKNLGISSSMEAVGSTYTLRRRLDLPELLPNMVQGSLSMESRSGRMPDLEFDQVISIEEVPNTTPYAYDLTVEDTRNFDCYNGLCMRDTFHMSGVSSKSNVTLGVPRIEEILRLTSNPKNPSLTVHLKPVDEQDLNKATVYATMMEHTRLVDVVESVQICFDPNPVATQIQDDRLWLEKFYEFERWTAEAAAAAASSADGAADAQSKWIVRFVMDAEAMLNKNITMDDIHFAMTNSKFANDIHCAYSDYNATELIFRVRINAASFAKGKRKGNAADHPRDQSDDIYVLKTFQDQLLNGIVLRGVANIENVMARKLQSSVVLQTSGSGDPVTKKDGKFVKKDTWVLDTTGTNLLETLALDYIDATRTYSNDIREVFAILGLEAARQMIYNEMSDVMEFSGGGYINYHHLGLLCDRMTCNHNMIPIFRSGLLSDDTGPIAKCTFEEQTAMLLQAARHGDVDPMRGVSANVMCGQFGNFGTSSFQLVLDMDAMATLEASSLSAMQDENGDDDDDHADTGVGISKSKMTIHNNIVNLKQDGDVVVDEDNDDDFDGADLGF